MSHGMKPNKGGRKEFPFLTSGGGLKLFNLILKVIYLAHTY